MAQREYRLGKWVTAGLTLLVVVAVTACTSRMTKVGEEKLPNFIVILTDDQGYGDLGCFGGEHVNTPNLDRMAAEGMKLKSFYVAAPVCTPSRAALMTGSYPKRINMAVGSDFTVLRASDSKGLHPDEITIAEVLKTKGYATGIMGKWHLGDQPEFLPTQQGFDEFFGLPYSHDMHPYHQNNKRHNFPDLPLLNGDEVIEVNPDMNFFTQRITERAVTFIEKNKNKPFFLYLPHPLPHRPLYASPGQMESAPDTVASRLPEEAGTVDYGLRDQLYPQAIATIDDSVGDILAALTELGLDKNTLILFTSDNGPARGGMGSTAPLKGRKGNTLEGGMRMPAVAWWPGMIPQGAETDEVLTTMDVLPTFAGLAGAELSGDRVIDGRDVRSVLVGKPSAALPKSPFYYFQGNRLEAVRYGNWKYHKVEEGEFLYDLHDDIGESKNLIAEYPEVAKTLVGHYDAIEEELGKGNSISDQCRPAGFVKHPQALTKSNHE